MNDKNYARGGDNEPELERDELFITKRSDLIAYRVYQKALRKIQIAAGLIFGFIIPIIGVFGYQTYQDINLVKQDIEKSQQSLKKTIEEVAIVAEQIKGKEKEIVDTLNTLNQKGIEIDIEKIELNVTKTL